jgi:hypothetical protein
MLSWICLQQLRHTTHDTAHAVFHVFPIGFLDASQYARPELIRVEAEQRLAEPVFSKLLLLGVVGVSSRRWHQEALQCGWDDVLQLGRQPRSRGQNWPGYVGKR